MEPGRQAFREAFTSAVTNALTTRNAKQQDLAEQIATKQHQHLPAGKKREGLVRSHTGSWASRISQWKSGARIPTSEDDLLLAMEVIAPGTTRQYWVELYHKARAEPRPVTAGAIEEPPQQQLSQVPGAISPGPVRPARAPRSTLAKRLTRLSRFAAMEAGRPLETRPGTAPETLGDLYVSRAAEVSLRRRISESAVTVITGEPGVGKTSLLWRLSEELEAAGRRWLFVRAVDLVPGRAASGTAQQVGLDELDDLVAATDLGERPPVLLIDTIDLLWRSREGRLLVAELLELAESWPTAAVLTCRDLEYDELDRVCRDPNAKKSKKGKKEKAPQEGEEAREGERGRQLKLGSYADDELGDAVERHAQYFLAGLDVDRDALRKRVLRAVTRGLPLREIVARPLTLRMLFETHRELLVHASGRLPAPDQGGDRNRGDTAASEASSVLDELDISDVYDCYWELRVCADERVGALEHHEPDDAAAAEFTALVMLSLGRPTADRTGEVEAGLGRADGLERARLREGLKNLTRRQVLLESGAGQVQFLHQTFFEYAAARALDRMAPQVLEDLAARVKDHPEDLFLAAVVQQLLVRSCLRLWDADSIDAFFAGLLGSGQSAHEQLAVTAYAMARYRGSLTADAGQMLLRRAAGLAQRYMMFLPRARHADMTSVLSDLAAIWQAHDRPQPRAAVLEAIAACAAQDVSAVRVFLLGEHVDWLTWFERLDGHVAQRVRGAPLALVEAMGSGDQRWAADCLVKVAAAVVRDTDTGDGLAAVLAAAARLLDRPTDLERMLDTVPDSDNHAPSGVDQLRDALAGLLVQMWAARDEDPVDLAERLSRAAVPWKGDPQRARHQAQWVALAELGLHLPEAQAEDLLAILLRSHEPALQTDIAERALSRLIEGPYRSPLPGMASDDACGVPSTACLVARRRCGEQLRDLPQPAKTPGRRRPVPTTCRSAFDQAAVPGEVIAEVLAGAFPSGVRPALWLDEEGLAALFGQAALGRHPEAQTALDEWATGQTLAMRGRENIIAHRLAKAAERGNAAAWGPLLHHAGRTHDSKFLCRAVEHAGDRGRAIPPEHLEGVAALAAELAQDDDQDRRGLGYDLYAELLLQPMAPAVPARTVLSALREGQLQVVTKALTLVERVLGYQPKQLSAPDVVDEFEQLLRRWTVPGGSATKEVVERAQRCLSDLFCRAASLEGEQRQRTLDKARQLSLNSDIVIARDGYWHLVTRLVEMDAHAAALEIVHASRAVHERLGEGRSSWRQRWARAAHRAVLSVVPDLEPSAWLEMLRSLVVLDQALLAVVVEVSADQRSTDETALLDTLLATARVDKAVTERLRLVRKQRERHTGSASRWPTLVTRWHELVPRT